MTIYNREDYKTALPQLEKMVKELAERVEKLEEENAKLNERVKELEDA